MSEVPGAVVPPAWDVVVAIDAESGRLCHREGPASDAFGSPDAATLTDLAQSFTEASCRVIVRALDAVREGRVGRGNVQIVDAAGAMHTFEIRATSSPTPGTHLLCALEVGSDSDTLAEANEARAFLEAAIRQSEFGIVLYQPGRTPTTIINDAARAILGVTQVEEDEGVLEATSWPEVRRGGVRIEPSDFPIVRAFTHHDHVVADEMEIVRATGELRTLLCSASPVLDESGAALGSIVLFTDVSGDRLRDQALREQNRLLQVFHEQIRDGVFALDSEGRIDYVTPSFERFTGRPQASLVGLHFVTSDLLDASSSPKAAEHLAAVLRGQTVGPYDYLFTTMDGLEPRIGEVEASPLTAINGRPRALFVVRDVTRKRREAAMTAQIESESRQHQKLEAVGMLAAGFAHEMNNPLTGVVNLAELLELGIVKPDGVADVALRIKALCDRMTKVVHRLLAFASVESQTTRTHVLADVVTSTIDLVGPRLRREGVAVDFSVPMDGGPSVEGRAGELQQLLMILLDNACAATRAADREPNRRVVAISMDVTEDDAGDRWARIHVTDHGCGISEALVHRVFEPFFRARPSERGLGLGLWVGRGIARDHGGRLELLRTDATGSVFRLELPVASGTRGVV